MICTVRYLLLSGARFFCYRYWSSLVLRNKNGTASFLHSMEGVTQGYPLYMVAYDIGILPLIKNLKAELPDATQPCCADDSSELGTFTNVKL